MKTNDDLKKVKTYEVNAHDLIFKSITGKSIKCEVPGCTGLIGEASETFCYEHLNEIDRAQRDYDRERAINGD